MTNRLSRGVLASLAPFALLGGCALQPAYERPPVGAPFAWANVVGAPEPPPPRARDGWWSLLGDPAVERLVAAGLRDNPTLEAAAARVDQARAALVGQDARRWPTVSGQASAIRSRDRAGPGEPTLGQTAATVGLGLSWEIDLWGRIGEGSAAAQNRLAARNAEADAARLSLVAETADTALTLRACHLTLAIRDADIASRETELTVTRSRLAMGALAPVGLATATSNLAAARTDRISQHEACQRLVDALVALSGLDAAQVRDLLPEPAAWAGNGGGESQMPVPPPFIPALPATVLLGHPAVVAAEREAAARWSDVGVARAERLPRLDLTAALSQQWLSALGSDSSFLGRSGGLGVTGPLFVGGAGAGNVRGAQAGYREAVALLEGTVRAVVRDIEDGLAAQASAAQRVESSAAALEAARFTLTANAARWRAGAIAQVELEESRRQFNRAQESAVLAAADRARAWVALVRRTGGPWEGAVTGGPEFAARSERR